MSMIPTHVLRGHGRKPLTVALMVLLSVLPLAGCAVAVHDHGPDKVLVCHKGKKTLSVSRPALGAHLDHGDYRGPCR